MCSSHQLKKKIKLKCYDGEQNILPLSLSQHKTQTLLCPQASLLFFCNTISSQSLVLHSSAHKFLHMCPQSKILLHISVQCLRSGKVLHFNVIECPHSGITFFT